MVGDCGYCSCCAVASSLENAFNQKAEQLITVDWIEMLNGVGGFCSRSSIFAWAGVEETISILKRDTFVIPILWSGIAGWNIIDSAGFLRLATFCLLAVGFLFRPFTSTVSYFFILFYLFFFFLVDLAVSGAEEEEAGYVRMCFWRFRRLEEGRQWRIAD